MIVYNKKSFQPVPTHIVAAAVNRSRSKILNKILTAENKIFLQSLNLKLK